jgi:hypothetical protein
MDSLRDHIRRAVEHYGVARLAAVTAILLVAAVSIQFGL